MKILSSFWISAVLLIALTGCSAKEPTDVSDPQASKKWIEHCIKEAENAADPKIRNRWQRKAYDHAAELGDLSSGELSQIPSLSYTYALTANDPEAFKWALQRGAEPRPHYNELIQIWKLGKDCRNLTITRQPTALPVFMSEAIDHHVDYFFDAHAEAFKATGFNVQSPLESSEFNIRYRRFIGEQLEEALQKGDDKRIRFLISQMPRIENPSHLDKQTKRIMQTIGDYVINTIKDETLAIQLIELRFALNPIDLSAIDFSMEFINAFCADPEYVIRTQQLDEWKGRISEADAKLVLMLPRQTWHLLNKSHLDEAIEINIVQGNANGAIRLIEFKNTQKPLNQSDYNELLSWALTSSNTQLFDYVLKQSGEIDIYNISFAALAMNQELFMKYAPQIMKRIYYTMDTEPRVDGTTIGRIKEVFSCGNENAGLYLIHKYNLGKEWEKATNGQTLLMDVCEAGNLKAARYLIEKRGENLFAQTGYSEIQITLLGQTKPKEGKLSPIFFAAKSGNSELIRYLHAKGANVNARSNYQTTPLMHAVSAGHLEAVKTLIVLKADVNVRMASSVEAFDLRKMGAYEEICTAYRRAQTAGNNAILDVLIEAGARP